MHVHAVRPGRVIVCLFCLTAQAALAGGGGGPFFQVWGAAGTDQSQDDIKPPNPPLNPADSLLVGDPSVGGKAHWVTDDELAGNVAPAKMAKLALDNGADIIWVFKVCFGGGFFDELNAIPGGGHNMAINSASRYNQKCWYPTKPANGGVGCDWLWAYIDSMGAGVNALAMATAAANDDPYGSNAGLPAAPPAACGQRGVEKVAKEQPQYLAIGGGAAMTLDAGETRLAIFWSGDPMFEDDKQIAAAITTLLAPPLNWAPDHIYILFRNGKVPGGGMILPLMSPPLGVGLIPVNNLNSARECRLEALFAAKYGPGKENPGRLLFVANDHGGSTDPRIKGGKGVAAIQEGDGSGQISKGDLQGPGDHDWPGAIAGTCTIGADFGACCLSSGLCTTVPATQCASLGGSYGGDGTECFADVPIASLVDPFEDPCIAWNSRKLRTLAYDSFTGGSAFTTADVTPDGTSTVLSSHIGHFRSIDDSVTNYSVTLDFSWTQAGNGDKLSAGLLLLDDADEIIISAGCFDDDAGNPALSYALFSEPPAAPVLTTGPLFALDDAAQVQYTVRQDGPNWTIDAKVQTAGGTTLLSTNQTTSRQPDIVEMFIERDHDPGVPFGSVSLEHFVMSSCPWDCGDGDGSVGIVDFLALLAEWGATGTGCDIDGGGVGINDFLELLAHWGLCP